MTEYSQTGEFPSDIPQFLKPCVLRKKYFKDSNTIAFIWREKYDRIFVFGRNLFKARSALSKNCSPLGRDECPRTNMRAYIRAK